MTNWAGVGDKPQADNYTWGGDPAARRKVDRFAHKETDDPHFGKGFYKARDDATGDWLWVQAGEMKGLNTTGMPMQSNGYGTSIPQQSANRPAAPAAGGAAPRPGGGQASAFAPQQGAPMGTAPSPYGQYSQGIKDLTAASQYTANTGTFDESRGAAGRVDAITSSASPLMTAARTRARQQMAGSGLQNSTMAGQAGEQAVIETATPLAQTDAGLYSNQRLANQQSLNDAARANAQMTGTIGMKGMDLNQSQNQFDAQLRENTRQFDTNQAGVNDRFKSELNQQNDQFTTTQTGVNERFNRELDSKEKIATDTRDHDIVMAKADRATRESITKMQGEHQQSISSNQDITNAWGTMMQGIGRIQNNPDLDSGTKDVLIKNEMAGFTSFASFWQKATGGTVDVSDLLNFGVVGTGTGVPSQPRDNGGNWNPNWQGDGGGHGGPGDGGNDGGDGGGNDGGGGGGNDGGGDGGNDGGGTGP